MPRIDDLALEHARAASTVEVLERMGHRPRGSGVWRAARCPFDDHRDRNASFSVNIQTGGWNCHGCGRTGGDAIELLMQVRSVRFEDAVSELSGMSTLGPVGVVPRRQAAGPSRKSPYASAQPSPVELATRSLAELRNEGYVPSAPASVYRCVLAYTTLEPHGAAYLAARGFDTAAAELAGFRSICSANDWSALYRTLGQSFLPDEIAAAGLSKPPFARDVPVVVFTYRTSSGEIDTIRLRRCDAGERRYHTLEGNGPHVPFGLESIGDMAGGHIHIVEGEFNAFAIRQCGRHALGIPGALGWPDEWSSLVSGAEHVTVVLDDDTAGRQGATKIAKSLAQVHGRAWVDARVDVQLWTTDAADLYVQRGLADVL